MELDSFQHHFYKQLDVNHSEVKPDFNTKRPMRENCRRILITLSIFSLGLDLELDCSGDVEIEGEPLAAIALIPIGSQHAHWQPRLKWQEKKKLRGPIVSCITISN